jgi:hypothetical protein
MSGQVPNTRTRVLGRIAVALLVPLLVIWPAGSAWAHHLLIRAWVSCGGVVSFVVEAWASHNPKARENPAIEVAYATGGGTFQPLPQKRSYAFAPASGYGSATRSGCPGRCRPRSRCGPAIRPGPVPTQDATAA